MSLKIDNLVAGREIGEHTADSNSFTGWKLHIHDSGEFPEVNRKGIFVGAGQEVSIRITAQAVESTPEVRAMSPQRRKCLLPYETSTSVYTMRLFKQYRKSSCHFQNTAFNILSEFKCLPYFMPSVPSNLIKNWVPDIDANSSLTCNSSILAEIGKKINMYSARASGTNDTRLMPSNNPTCFDECDYTKYTFSLSSATLEDNENFFYQVLLDKGEDGTPPTSKRFFAEYERYVQDTFKKAITSQKWNGRVEGPSVPGKFGDDRENCVANTVKNKIKKMTYLHVYYDSFGVTKFTKSELYGWQDLIGVFGGIVGLCMGFSLLSAAEFFYFFTVRLWFCQNAVKKLSSKKYQR